MLVFSAQDAVLDANPRACRLLGFGYEELVTLRLGDLADLSDRSWGSILEAEYPTRTRIFDLGLVRHDGTTLPADISLTGRTKTGDGRSWGMIFRRLDEAEEPDHIDFRDVAEREQLEEALRQSEGLYRAVVEQTTENVYLVDVESRRILEANSALVEALGYAPEELRNLTLYDVIADDRESIDNNVRRVLKEGRCYIGERRVSSQG